MSAQHLFTPSRVVTFFLLAVLFAFSFFTPRTASADELPPGVIEQSTCGQFAVDVYAYGTGMMQGTAAIEISNQRVSYIDPAAGCAVVEWDSSTPAASQVIFGQLSDEPIGIRLSEPGFGYAYTTTQNNSGSAHHIAVLEGLEPGVVYSYRTVTRAHPSALPSISDPQVLIATVSAPTPQAVPEEKAPEVTPPATTVYITGDARSTPYAPSTPSASHDFEKFPTTPAQETQPPSQTEQPDTATTTDASEVPSAANAADTAIGASSHEGALWRGAQELFTSLFPEAGSLHGRALIIPLFILLAILLALQQLVLPALGITLRTPLLYWLFGAVILTTVSAVFMFYYVTLVGIALFLGLLAWYLLQSTPEDATILSATTKTKPTGTKDTKTELLESKEMKDTRKKKK